MKPIIQKLWMFIAVLCASLSASANGLEFVSGGLRYNILSDRTVEVAEGNSHVSGDIEIPRRVIYDLKTYTVTSIGVRAFMNCSGLTSVTIPNSVTSIGDYAFCGCGLTSVTIPNSVTSIGDDAFCGCDLTSVTIPNSVTSIGEYAFCGCDLTSVTIPNSVASIGEYAFCGCDLTSVTIPNSVTFIGDKAFSCSRLENINVDSENDNFSSLDGILYNKDVTNLICCPEAKTSVTIPNSVTSIGASAFYECRSLTSVTIPNSVTSIGNSTFRNCSRLTSVTIPNSVTSIGYNAFYNCESLKVIYMQCEVPIECDPRFSETSLKEAVLYVPTGTMAEYEKVDPWRNFWNIEEMDFTGVDGIEADNNDSIQISVNNGILTIDGIGRHESVTVYDMRGSILYNGLSHTIDKLSPGIYIVKVGSSTIKISI